MRPEFTGWTASIRRWVDTQAGGAPDVDPNRIDWARALPFALLHAGCLGALWTGVSPAALAMAAMLYTVRMFALTGFYHLSLIHISEPTRPY